jgi:hypothetical protein
MPPKAKKLGRPSRSGSASDEKITFRATSDELSRLDRWIAADFMRRLKDAKAGHIVPRAYSRAQAIRALLEKGMQT